MYALLDPKLRLAIQALSSDIARVKAKCIITEGDSGYTG